MANKSSSSTTTQSAYLRREIVHVCLNGKTYGRPLTESTVTPTAPVDTRRGLTGDLVMVTQRSTSGVVVEAWYPVRF